MEPNVIAKDAPPDRIKPDVIASIQDYQFPEGWSSPDRADARARECCALLEEGKMLFFDRIPFDFPLADREFLLSQRQSGSKLHKNISYRPRQDIMRGAAGSGEEVERLHQIMRRFSAETTRLCSEILAPYAAHWSLDYASYRPEEEKGRDLPLHKRNDLLHFDSFPTRPMHGRRILRCFTNINPTVARVWNTTDGFDKLAAKYADQAGLARFAARGVRPANPLVSGVKRMFGLKAVDHSPYDRFMLRFHDFLKEQADFQANCPKTRLEFPPGSTWMCFTDSVPHAVLSGQYALEQTFIVPLAALVTPEKAPIRILEKIAGTKLAAAL
jgi:hypothetical protein